MKTEDDLASGILLLATIETLLVVLSGMLSAPTGAELIGAVQAAGAERAAGTPAALSWQRALAFAAAYRTVYLGILVGL